MADLSAPWGLAITPPGLPRLEHRTRADASRCPIRIISVHLLVAPGFREAVAASQLLRVLFLDREGHISAQPHYVPHEQALILAANQQRVLGPQAEVRVL
jgi:hypothetical protein